VPAVFVQRHAAAVSTERLAIDSDDRLFEQIVLEFSQNDMRQFFGDPISAKPVSLSPPF
jgi:hypothetical protein